MLFDNVDTAKMHGLDTSNVSSRVESSYVEFGSIANNLKRNHVLGSARTGNSL